MHIGLCMPSFLTNPARAGAKHAALSPGTFVAKENVEAREVQMRREVRERGHCGPRAIDIEKLPSVIGLGNVGDAVTRPRGFASLGMDGAAPPIDDVFTERRRRGQDGKEEQQRADADSIIKYLAAFLRRKHHNTKTHEVFLTRGRSD